jgi:hypothetical protein
MTDLERFQDEIVNEKFENFKETWNTFDVAQKISIASWFYKGVGDLPKHVIDGKGANAGTEVVPDSFRSFLLELKQTYNREKKQAELAAADMTYSGSRRRRRPSRKYKKSSKRVFRKKSRSTRRR